MTHYRACNLCEAICGLVIETEDNHVVSIRGDRDDPFSQGYLCPKALALQDVNEDPERLRQPLRRTATGWETIDWDTAIATVVDRLADIQDAHGRDAVAVYRGNPSVHNSGTILTASAFGKALGSRRNYSATSVDQLPHHYAAFLQFGHQLLLPVPDIDRTDFLLILGGNPLVSNGSIMTAPNVRGRLRAIGERGGRVVVVDPARTRTAELADTHLAPLPGTDVFLLLALVKIVLTEGLADLGHLSGCTDGIAELTDFVRPFQLPELAAACDLPETEIRELAHAFAAAPSAVAYGRMGVSTQQYGGYCQWLVNVLNAITGNLDRPGGAMFTTPAVDVLKQVSRGHVGRQRSKVRQLPSFGGELPVATLGEDILARDGERDIRALVTIAGNPIVSTPNAGQLERAIESLDFVVAIDIYLNETTRHADIILPPTTGLETDHYDLVFNLLAVRNVAKYSPATLAPGPDTRHDHEIFNALTSGLHARRGTDSWMKKLQRWVSPERQLDLGLRLGPHSLTMSQLKREPHGIDLGPLRPCLPDRLFTDDKRTQLMPPAFAAGREDLLAASRHSVPDRTANRFLLIGRRALRTNNSWLHRSPRLRKNNSCELWMHPADAETLNLGDGAQVQCSSTTGELVVPLRLTDALRRGVVSLPHGWGQTNVNELTPDDRVDAVTGNAVLNGVWVRVAG